MAVNGNGKGLLSKNPSLLAQARDNLFLSGSLSWPKFIPLVILGAMGWISPTFLMTAIVLPRWGMYSVSDSLFRRTLTAVVAIVLNVAITAIFVGFALDKPELLQAISFLHKYWVIAFLLAGIATGVYLLWQIVKILLEKRR